MNKITCMIIDDEKPARARMEYLLRMIEEVKILAVVDDSDRAAREITMHEPDITFIDVEMPGKSGLEVVQEVKEAGLSTTFIFATAYDQYAIKAIKSAAFDYLLKPIDIDDLKEAIDRYKELNAGEVKLESRSKTDSTNKQQARLSHREKEIIQLVADGKTSNEIAGILFISKNTVDTHRRNILEKTGMKSSAELVRYAIEKKTI